VADNATNESSTNETTNSGVWGCVASDMGARNATCCSAASGGGNNKNNNDDDDYDYANTGCPSGYECRVRVEGGSGGLGRRRRGRGRPLYDCVLPEKKNGGDPFLGVLTRYHLCEAEESNTVLYGLGVPIPAPVPLPVEHDGSGESSVGNGNSSTSSTTSTTIVGKLAYYSNLGPIEPTNNNNNTQNQDSLLSGVQMALVVIHGANRNGDDYFCSAKATTRLQKRFAPGTVLVVAPVFLDTPSPPSSSRSPSSSFLYWNDSHDKDGSWRYGADASGTTISSFDAMDALLATLRVSSLLPGLRRIVVAGHSSGGQFVQRWSLLAPSRLWPVAEGGRPYRASGGGGGNDDDDDDGNHDHQRRELPISLHAIVANPSSYVYLTPLRYHDDDDDDSGTTTTNNTSSTRGSKLPSNTSEEPQYRTKSKTHPLVSWKIPSVTQQQNNNSSSNSDSASCPFYNQWEWGLEDGGSLDVPYRKRALSKAGGSFSGIVERYLSDRSVLYLSGNLDRCRESGDANDNDGITVENGPTAGCDSHGLETTCADDLQGKNRYERSARYWASLSLVDRRRRHGHHRIVVPQAGHDHSVVFQSREGIFAIYYFENGDVDGRGGERTATTQDNAVSTGTG